MNENQPLRCLDLYTGAGGNLGPRMLGWRTVCAVEIEPYCQEILIQRMRDGVLEPFPIWPDADTFDPRPWVGAVDIITGGFPCQPFSCAGNGAGEKDPRNQWPNVIRILRGVECRQLFVENVRNLLAHDYFGQILGDLASCGFDARWSTLSAAQVGANHKRERLWLYAWK